MKVDCTKRKKEEQNLNLLNELKKKKWMGENSVPRPIRDTIKVSREEFTKEKKMP